MNERHLSHSLPANATAEQYADFLQHLMRECQPAHVQSVVLIIDSVTGKITECGSMPNEYRHHLYEDALIYHGTKKKEKPDG